MYLSNVNLWSALSLLVAVARSVKYVGVTGGDTDWDTAKLRCESGVYVKVSGGQLATWDNYETYRDAVVVAAIPTGIEAWVGLSDKSQEGTWRFIDGATNYCADCDGGPNGIEEWVPGQPNEWSGESSQDCALIWDSNSKRGDAHGLNDLNCGNSRPFVCEFPDSAFEEFGTSMQGKYSSDDSMPLSPDFHDGNYYVLEFTSIKDVIIIASIAFNVIAVVMICYLTTKLYAKKASKYAKVNMYTTDDEKI